MRPTKLAAAAAGWWIALAGAALAGPTTTTIPGGTTTTTTLGTTTTTTPGTTTTTTTAPPTTTTAPPTTTTTSTTTTTTTTTTTLPPVPGDLTGVYPFADKSTGNANTSLLNVDESIDQVCVAGQLQEFDRTATPFNRSVTYTYQSIAPIVQENDKKVRADATSVSLRLEIVNLDPSLTTPEAALEYDQTITADCKLKASLLKAGAKDKVSLQCDLGESFSAFPGLTSELLENIQKAALKNVKVNTKKGRLKVSNSGVFTQAGVPVTCDFPAPG